MQIILGCEAAFTDGVKLEMMEPTEANRPFVGRLKSYASVGPAPHVGAFDRETTTSRDAAKMAPDPGPMRSTVTGSRLSGFGRRPSGKAQLRHRLCPALAFGTCWSIWSVAYADLAAFVRRIVPE